MWLGQTGNLLRVRWALGFPANVPPPGGPGFIYSHLWQVGNPHQLQQDGGGGLPSLLNARLKLGGGLLEAGDGGGTILPGESVGAVQVPGVIGGFDSRVSGVTSTGPEWEEPGTSVGGHPAPSIPKTLQGLFSAGIRLSGMPSGGLWGSGIDAHQPPDSLRAPPHVGNDTYFGVR